MKIFLVILTCLFGTTILAEPTNQISCEQQVNVSCLPTCKNIVVTSASGQLGKAVAKELAPHYNLILTGRDLFKLQALQKELQLTYPEKTYEVYVLDYTNRESIDMFGCHLSKSPALSGFVLIGPRPEFYDKAVWQTQESWEKVFQETFIGPIASLQKAIPCLLENSKVVIISGSTSVQIQPTTGAACVIRSALSTYSKALSHELGPKGITVNSISPGIMLTDFHENRIKQAAAKAGRSYEEQMELDTAQIPLHKHISVADAAKTIKFLLSEDSIGINGVNLVIDSGFTTAL